MIRTLERTSGFEAGEYVHRMRPDNLPGRWARKACHRRHGDSVQRCRTCGGKPWAKIWEECHEKGMQRPEER